MPECEKYQAGFPVPVTSLAAAPGEANRVTITREGEEFVLTDAGAPVVALAPCTQVDASTVRCPFTAGIDDIAGLAIDAGDGADEVTITGDPGAESVLAGGLGDDAITGGEGNDTIDGGPGDDRLAGGGGLDTLTYARLDDGVEVDLRTGSGGVAGETDTVSGFGTLIGGAGADVLLGSGADERIDGGPGADTVEGRAGDDDLFGSRGPDVLRGGAGEDRLFGDPFQGDGFYTPIIRLADDRLEGDAGDDVLRDTGGRNTFIGGSGRDRIEGGAGRDRVRAGSGDDGIFVRGGSRDTVDCGAGRDRARTDRGKDTRRRCERR